MGEGRSRVRTLAECIPVFLAAPMQFEPGSRWQYCQSGINTAAHIVEIVSGQSFDKFLVERLFRPLGMKDTGHDLTVAQATRLATAYAKNRTTGELEPQPKSDSTHRTWPPTGNAGLYSTAPDYARFCQMLLSGGELDGRRYLSTAAVKQLSTVQTGDLPAGFFQSAAAGGHGAAYGWGVGVTIEKQPHAGVAAMLSPGTFGHGGAWGTQAWIDPVKGVAYILMVQRTNFRNSDGSDVRLDFQQAAADALGAR
jgi:CubicO group peptidase (beta-lactamase class C family)